MGRARVIAALVAASTAAALAVVAVPQAGAATDTTAPTITSFSALETTVTAGDPVALRYTAVDDLAGVWDVTAQLQGPGGTTIGLLGPGGDWSAITAAGGPVSGVVPSGAPAGTYTLVSLVVADKAGNSTTYQQGQAVSTPAGSPPVLDLSSVTVTVVQPGGTPDTTAPRLTKFAMVSPSTRRPGEFATFAFTATDDRSPITDVRVEMHDDLDAEIVGVRGGGILSSGRVSVWFPPDLGAGTGWFVARVTVTDSSGNSRTYSSYSWMQVSLVAGSARPDPLVMLDERPDPVVRTTPSRSLVATGTAVSVAGTVSYAGRPVPYPTVAVYAETALGRTFLGLAHGNADGAFSKRAVVSRTTVFRVRFLGGDRGIASPSGFGAGARVLAGAPQTLTVASTSVGVRRGSTGVLAVTLAPRRAAVVTLWRWSGRAWVTVVAVRTRSTGAVALRVPRPIRATAYRWTTGYDGVGLPTVSRTVTVRAV